jgi:pimeloyl-ACP methyl ester carboxylesterase
MRPTSPLTWTSEILVLASARHLAQLSLERLAGALRAQGLHRHAYAGAVIAATTDEKVRSLVYIAALAPDEGETVAEVFYREEPHPQAPRLQPDAYGLIWMPEEGFQSAFAQNASDDVKAITASVQRPIAVRCIQELAPKPAWRSKPSWFLIAEEDRMINPKTQRFMAERMAAKVRVHPVDHTPLLTAPELVVDIIREAARETLTSQFITQWLVSK